MRQYKFRAKRVDNGQWVYGSLVKGYDAIYIVYEAFADDYKYGYDVVFIPVVAETVGISLCLPDKNDKEIYEGDIVEGHMGWCTGDGYLKKIYPRKIRIRMEVVFNPKGWEAGFHLYEIGVHPDDRLARKDNFYRDVEYRLQESQGPWVNNEPNYLGKCTTLEVVGNKFDNPELYNL